MTFSKIVQYINTPTKSKKYTDFYWDDFFILSPGKPITKRTAKRQYEASTGKKAPKIKQAFYVEARA
jgi:hypothetical protein